eukprot:GHVL01002740.1.p1 GENE.GHVL01002740.1~~GHVL01002740.1.p1  ORF type:complete len:266 (-),score=79.84 GHVL01002740.1:752-1549(-)
MSINNFIIARIPIKTNSPFFRDCLIKQHEPSKLKKNKKNEKNDDKIVENTIFIGHLDSTIDEKSLKMCMDKFDPVKDIDLKKVKNYDGYGCLAHVEFSSNPTILEEARIAASRGESLNKTQLNMPKSVYKKSVSNILNGAFYSNSNDLQKRIDDWMAAFDKRVSDEALAAQKAGVPDDDGFITVVRSAGVPKPMGVSSSSTRHWTDISSAVEKKKKSTVLTDFYRFQIHEKKREELVNERRKRIKDENIIQKMKKQKKFKIQKDN